MRRRGLTVVIIAVVAAALVGTWTVAYRAGESDGRTKISTDRSIFQTRIASGPQTGAGGTGQNTGAGGSAAAGGRGPAGGSAAAGAGTVAPGGGSAVAGGSAGTPGAGRAAGAATNLTG